MIRKLFVVLMLLVLLPTVLSLDSDFDSDNDGVSDTNDPFPLDPVRSIATDGSSTIFSEETHCLRYTDGDCIFGSFEQPEIRDSNRERYDLSIVRPMPIPYSSFIEYYTWNNPTRNFQDKWSQTKSFSPHTEQPQILFVAGLVNPISETIYIYTNKGYSDLATNSRSQSYSRYELRPYIHPFTTLSSTYSPGECLTFDYEHSDICKRIQFNIHDINLIDLNSDGNLDIVIVANPEYDFDTYRITDSTASTFADGSFNIPSITAYKNYLLILKGTGDSDLFESIPIMYKLPNNAVDIEFLSKNSFVYITNQTSLYKRLNKIAFTVATGTQNFELAHALEVTTPQQTSDYIKDILDISKDKILTLKKGGEELYIYDHQLSLEESIQISDGVINDAKFIFWNDDEFLDIVVAKYYDDTDCGSSSDQKNIEIWLGNQNSIFQESQKITSEDLTCISEIDTGDIDKDGDYDLFLNAETQASSNSPIVYLNPGTLEVPEEPEAETPEDIDGDGISDAEDKCPNENPGDFDKYYGRYYHQQSYQSGSSGTADGCIDDSDKDEVQENLDMCPNTLEDEEVDNIGCGVINQKSKIILSSNKKVGVPISGIIKNLGEDINGAFSYFNKEIKIIYWFNGIKENKQIINDAGTLICAESLDDTSTCSVYNGNRVDITINYSSTNNLIEEGLECSCINPSNFDDNIPMNFKINPRGISTQTSITETFINTYTALENCDYTPPVADTEEETDNEDETFPTSQFALCKISAMIFYEDGTDEFRESHQFGLHQSDTSDEELVAPTNNAGEESPFGIYSQSCEYGNAGERIEGSEWCCIQGYLAKEVGALNSLNPDEAACTQYENKIPNAVISTNVTNISIGETITFDASSSRDSDGIIKEYIWTFGDGSPQETGVTVEHKFETACAQDICIITLNVKDNFNNIGEEIINLNMTGIIVSEVNGTQVNGTQVDDKEEDDSETVDASAGDDGTGGVYDWGATSEEDDEDDGTKGSAAGWLIILAILVIMGGVYFAFKKGLFSKKKEPEPIDLDSETFEAEEPVKEKKDTGKMSGFISDQKDKGLSNEEIRQKLLGKGLSDDEVDKHMNESRE